MFNSNYDSSLTHLIENYCSFEISVMDHLKGN